MTLRDRPAPLVWMLLLLFSAVASDALSALHLPATLLLGPMLAAIAAATVGAEIRVAQPLFVVAQAVVGALIARSIPPSILGEVGARWPLFVSGVLSVVVAAYLLGYALARLRALPGPTAVLGSSPGAASAMMLMAEANGADTRLVAFMQYLRVAAVAASASIVAKLVPGHAANVHTTTGVEVAAATPPDWHDLAVTLALIAVGVATGRFVRVGAGALLVPLVLGIVVQGAGVATVTLPPWLLAISYALLGWSIGLRFTPEIVAYAARALPRVLAAIVLLIAICAGFAAVLVRVAGIDPLTAFLAMSPGGADSVAIIASSTPVDVAFVMTMQTARFVVVLAIGPLVARLVARAVPGPSPIATSDRRA